MIVYRSNDLPALADQLAQVVRSPGLGLLQTETILIQSAGMERWLSRELSSRLGILANCEFPFPRSFLRRTIDAALGPDERVDAYERKNLTWVLFDLLRSPPDTRPFDAVRENLKNDDGNVKRLLLAERLANLFDQYLTFRPQMMLSWEGGAAEDDFQAVLFRQIVGRLGSFHLAARSRSFLEEVSDERLKEVLPCRVSLVGGPGLPPLFLQLFGRIGRAIALHVFSFSPTEEYFADLHPLDPLPEVGVGVHPLLVSLGQVGGDYQYLLEQVGEYVEGEVPFRKHTDSTLLSALKRDIASGAKRKREDLLPQEFATDGSFTLDSCHSRLREVEILHDRLLFWFKEDPTLRAEDVVVLAPDIEAYSPLISAVFAAQSVGPVKIPFRVADRSEGATNPAARALLIGLRLLSGRFKASEVLDFLQLDPVLTRFGLDAPGLERIAEWLRDSGVRWGADGKHRAQFGLPEDEEATLRRGLERLLLGYAHADDGDCTLDGVVPFDDVPAGDAELLGRYAHFQTALLAFRERAAVAFIGVEGAPSSGLTPGQWALLLQEFVDQFIGESPESLWDTNLVRRALDELLGAMKAATPDDRLGLSALTHLLAGALSDERPSTDFLAGGITFCELLPLRTIPFRRVVVLGLEQGVFPRIDAPHQLDRMAASPRRGDRTLRGDDRYLFLEVLLAAEERLALSYVGRSVQDNSECPPSAILEDLRQALQAMLIPGEPGARAVAPLAPQRHPLQPFSPRYFAAQPTTDGDRVASLNRAAFLGAQALVSRSATAGVTPFVRGSLNAPAGGERVTGARAAITLTDFEAFWRSPVRAFLRGLSVFINDEIEQFEDREPLEANALLRHQLGEELIASGGLVDAIALGRGQLPLGAAGRVLLQEIRETGGAIAQLAQQEAARRLGERPTPSNAYRFDVAVPTSVGEVRVSGSVKAQELFDAGAGSERPALLLSTVTYGTLDGKRQLRAWTRHLLVSASGRSATTLMVGRKLDTSGGGKADDPVAIEWPPLPKDEAVRHLQLLIEGFFAGQSAPLLFFPNASFAAERARRAALDPKNKRIKRSPREHALFEGHQALRPHYGTTKESLEPEVAVAFRGQLPVVELDDARKDEFLRQSEGIFGPLLDARKELA